MGGTIGSTRGIGIQLRGRKSTGECSRQWCEIGWGDTDMSLKQDIRFGESVLEVSGKFLKVKSYISACACTCSDGRIDS